MPILRYFLVAACLIMSTLASAKTLPTIEKMDKVSNHFMDQIKAGEIESAYSIMSAYLGVDMTSFLDRAKKVENDMKQFQDRIGAPLSYALLEKQAVGEHFYKITYLLKYETAALIWELNFYQPEKGWKLVDINFNTDINSLFK